MLSPALIFAAAYVNDDFTPYGVAAFLLMAAVAVFLFVYYGNIQGAYTKLLEEPHITVEMKEEERIMGVVGAVMWPLATVVFLFSGFVRLSKRLQHELSGKIVVNFPLTTSCHKIDGKTVVNLIKNAHFRRIWWN